MKKSVLKFALLSLVLTASSCIKDETPAVDIHSNGIQDGDETGIDCGGSSGNECPVNNELSGEISDAQVLDASIEYDLTGALIVREGGSLTIPAGTVIKASGGTSSYIAVAQGGLIYVNGTSSNPVVMTSAAESPAAGDWGGLVLCGKAPTNVGATATSEVADLTYGGTDANDSSGVLKYLRVEYTGATFNSSKEFNGVSFFGVGAGTTVDYIQSYEGGDDGLEFFGGTVNPTHLVSVNSGDDSIDFADGWSGNGSYWYILGGAKAGIEGSNNGDNGAATPMTTATLSNISIVGPVTEGALYFKEGGGKFTIDNFYAKGVNLGVKVKSTDTNASDRIEAGELIMTNVQFADSAEGFVAHDYTGTTQSFISEGITTGAGSGAAAPSWTQGWTVGLDNTTAATTENIQGEIATDISLDASIEYYLSGSLVIKDGGSLTIPAGTIIKATGGTSSYIAVAQGGQIFVNGTADAPVIMTSNASTPAAGDWGGLVLCGKAPTNVGATATSEVADLTYGGTVTDDNSGVLKYLRVEYTGATFNSSKEFNGVSFFGVGSGTTVDYVQSYEGGDDGIEFFGGTVNATHLVSINSGDDSIDFADGWNGTGSHWYIKGGAKAGIEGSNNGDNGAATPMTTTTLSNITVVGPVTEGALYFKEGGGKFTIDNFYTTGIDKAVKVKTTDTNSIARIDGGDLTITNMQFDNKAEGFVISDYAAVADHITEGTATGAGNGAAIPDWAASWIKQ